MSAGGARRGRRDNGLDAADYAAAGDVDPRVGEHLLDVLAAGGIAAYLQPSADLNPILRATTLPARPTDRLYVDRAHLDAAREQLHKLTGGTVPTPPPPRPDERKDGDQNEVDAAGRRSSRVSTPPSTRPRRRGPPRRASTRARSPEPPAEPGDKPAAATDISGIQLNRRRTDRRRAVAAGRTGQLRRRAGRRRRALRAAAPAATAAHLEVRDRRRRGVVLGFVLFLFPTLLPVDRNLVTLIGFTAIVAGAVTLVWRLRSGDDDDEFDDGAVV